VDFGEVAWKRIEVFGIAKEGAVPLARQRVVGVIG
jgi:hypothetical protein